MFALVPRFGEGARSGGGRGAGPWPCPHRRTWARLRPGLGIFHLGGSTGRWPGLPTWQEQIHYDRLAESFSWAVSTCPLDVV